MLFYLLAFLVLAVDQLIKYFVHRGMALGQSFPLVDGIIKLTYVRNTGAAFSLFSGFSHYLIVIGLIIILLVIYFHHKIPSKWHTLQIALAFILGGSLGNLMDRIFRSYVIDYIDLTIWPVFNLSDIMINLGVILIIFELFLKGKKNVSGSI
jgi:signal peptidase II